MDQWVETLNQGWVGATIGLVGVLFGLYHLLRRTGPRLCYQFAGQRLIEGSGSLLPESVTVSYEGAPVPRLSLTYIVVWNSGYAPVRGEDVSQHDPILFKFFDGEVLRAEIVRSSRASNNQTLQVDMLDPKNVFYDFSFLDQGDGALIRILHTSKRSRPRADGSVIGLPRGLEDMGTILLPIDDKGFPPFSTRFSKKLAAWSLVIIGLGIMVIAGVVPQFSDEEVPTYIRGILGAFGLLYALTGAVFLWQFRRRFPAALALDQQENAGPDAGGQTKIVSL